MTEFAGLKVKMYAYKIEGKPSIMRIKGLIRSAVRYITNILLTVCLLN